MTALLVNKESNEVATSAYALLHASPSGLSWYQGDVETNGKGEVL
jgi:hypothetical protein